MKNSRLFFGIVAVVIILLGVAYMLEKRGVVVGTPFAENNRLLPATTSADIQRKFTECKALPNGSTQSVKGGTKTYVYIPKDLYPNVNIAINSNGATATDMGDGKAYGHAGTTSASCWSYYFQFDGAGTVDLISKSGTTGVPDYVLHFQVTKPS
jgi:hypothetical protein